MKNIVTNHPGPTIPPDQFKEFEKQLGEKLPGDYRKYLQKYNGADTKRDRFSVKGFSGSFWIDYMLYLDEYLFKPNEESIYDSISFNHFRYGDYIPKDCLVIGTVCTDYQLLLRYKGPRKGEIWIKINETGAPYGASEEYCKYRDKSMRKLAGSFSEFMKILSEYEPEEKETLK